MRTLKALNPLIGIETRKYLMMMFAPKPIIDLSLAYLVRNSEPHNAEQHPLLLLLHGVGSDEQDLFGLTDDI